MWEEIREEIFENDQMDIYEKMCLLVLLSLGEDVNITSEELARYMGCGVVTAKKAFEALKIKGYLEGEKKDYHPVSGNVLRGDKIEVAQTISQTFMEEVDGFREGFFKEDPIVHEEIHGQPLQPKKEEQKVMTEEEERRERLKAYILGEDPGQFVSQKEKKNTLVDQVIEIIEEKISFKEANIILGFADNNIDLIKRKYQMAKKSQVSDTLSVLINMLQMKESNIIKETEQVTDSQINKNRILKMQAYQNQKKR